MKRLITIQSILFFSLALFFETTIFAAAPATTESVEVQFYKQAKPNEFVYRQAQAADLAGIVTLINTQAAKDNDKIVVLPKKFREGAVAGAIAKGRLFIAEHVHPHQKSRTIVGFKKLYCLPAQEHHETLKEELRFADTATHSEITTPQLTAAKQSASKAAQESVAQIISGKTTYIYDGADFTHPDCRRKGINVALTLFALENAKTAAVAQIKEQSSTHLAIAYGLAKANAGNGILDGRTPGIAKAFIPFAQDVAQMLKHSAPTSITLARFAAFMPTFDPEATECKPLPDAQSIPGFGCLLACKLEMPIKSATHK